MKTYSFSLDLSPHKENQEVLSEHILDFSSVPGTGPGTRLEPKGWTPKSDEEGLSKGARTESLRA